MSKSIVEISALSAVQRGAWRDFQASNRALASPYFSLEFAQAMAAARKDTYTLLIHRNSRLAGFLPLQLTRHGTARPLGSVMGDHQAIISEDDRLDPSDALRDAGIRLYRFNGALAGQCAFSANAFECSPSWSVDLSAGFEAYIADRRTAEAKAMRNLRARRRKIDALGDTAIFRIDDRRPHALNAMIAMKRAQFRRTRAPDVFSGRWPRRLIDHLFTQRGAGASGLLSTLEINGEIAAAHFGMRSAEVLHYWFPVYAQAYAALGPGLALFMDMAKALAADGVTTIHMGGGDYSFKRRFSNASFDIVRGAWAKPGLAADGLSLVRGIEEAARKMPIGRASAWPGKAFRRLDKYAAIHG